MLRPEEPPEPRAGAAAAEESGARRLARCLTPPPGEEVREVEEAIEELLRRLDEFCGITEAIRSDTSQILDETIPLIKDKAFVKMVARHVSFLEEQVLEAVKSHGTFLNTVCKLFQCATISSFENRHPLSAARSYDLPKLYRTEDFFPMSYISDSVFKMENTLRFAAIQVNWLKQIL
ncbi:breast carcinoma-amplified sequence 4 isoform X2 [Aptenodytes patagonicus]|uniref:breast carcinoma-amplified sequence 4 isoform X2 n=1 Tax=Aptenodytes patagonicus TaxID=9234 RepID=UPI003F9F91BE